MAYFYYDNRIMLKNFIQFSKCLGVCGGCTQRTSLPFMSPKAKNKIKQIKNAEKESFNNS